MARKTLRTVSMTGITLPLISAELLPGETVEVDNVAAFGDSAFSNIGRGIKQHSDISLTCLDEGVALGINAGDVIDLVLSETFSDGTSEATRSLSEKVTISSVEPGESVAVDGERKATINITVIPVGGDGGATQSTSGVPASV